VTYPTVTCLPTPGQAPEAAAGLVQALSRAPASEVIVVGYGDEDDVLPALSVVAGPLPWPVREVMRVEEGRGWSLTCPDPA